MVALTEMMAKFCSEEDNWLSKKRSQKGDPGTFEVRDGNGKPRRNRSNRRPLISESFLAMSSASASFVCEPFPASESLLDLPQVCINQVGRKFLNNRIGGGWIPLPHSLYLWPSMLQTTHQFGRRSNLTLKIYLFSPLLIETSFFSGSRTSIRTFT